MRGKRIEGRQHGRLLFRHDGAEFGLLLWRDAALDRHRGNRLDILGTKRHLLQEVRDILAAPIAVYDLLLRDSIQLVIGLPEDGSAHLLVIAGNLGKGEGLLGRLEFARVVAALLVVRECRVASRLIPRDDTLSRHRARHQVEHILRRRGRHALGIRLRQVASLHHGFAHLIGGQAIFIDQSGEALGVDGIQLARRLQAALGADELQNADTAFAFVFWGCGGFLCPWDIAIGLDVVPEWPPLHALNRG